MAQEKTQTPKDPQEKTLQNDDKKPKENPDPQALGKQKHKFMDENGDGVDDNMPMKRMRMGKGMGKGKGMDNFEDKDGDGINDNRACGMGWKAKGMKGGLGRHGK